MGTDVFQAYVCVCVWVGGWLCVGVLKEIGEANNLVCSFPPTVCIILCHCTVPGTVATVSQYVQYSNNIHTVEKQVIGRGWGRNGLTLAPAEEENVSGQTL